MLILVGGGSLGLGVEEMPMQAMEQTHADVMLCGDVTEWTTCAYIRDAMQLGQNKAMIKLGHERSEEAGMEYMVTWLPAIFHAEVFSKCLMRLVDVDICLPIEDLVEPQPQEGPFPTLYLLHGYTGRSEDWLHGSCIAELSRQYGIAVVMPSGENSFYEDDTEAGFLYSTFVGQELVELTRAAFPLCRDREHTWMAGLSMGGFGTLLNACKFSETFSAAACFSSAFIIQDIAGMKPGAVIPSGVGNYGYYRRVFGDLDALAGGPRDPLYWAQKAKQTGTLPRLYLACGTEDSLFPNNTVMRKELEGLGADVTWFQGPGAHSWQFWDQEIKKAVPWMLNAEKQEVDDETQRV